MKNRLFFPGIFSFMLISVLAVVIFTGCPTTGGGDPPKTQYTVSFDGGNGSGTPPASQTVPDGSSITLPGRGGLTPPEGQEFDGWRAGGLSYSVGDAYTVTANVTFIAQWKNTAQQVPQPTASPLKGTWFYTQNGNVQNLVSLFTDDVWYYITGTLDTNCTLDLGVDNYIYTGNGAYSFEISDNKLTIWRGSNKTVYNKRLDGTPDAANPGLGLWIVDDQGPNARDALLISRAVGGQVTLIEGNYQRNTYTLTANSNAAGGTIQSPGSNDAVYQLNSADGILKIAGGVLTGNMEFTLSTKLFPPFF
ncbi:MAG: InlB B-repeat-containing protein [Treponema sp.]|jgi:hypothetical protein|nr:InlB B-repeat-containing protein [Treponema sp.]